MTKAKPATLKSASSRAKSSATTRRAPAKGASARPTRGKAPQTGTRSGGRRPGTTASSAKSQARKTAPARSRPVATRLSPERKIDLIGIVLAVLGLLTLLSLLSANRSSVTGWWVGTLEKLSGWGVYVLPVGLLLIGLWLILRNIERLPQVSTERIFGVTLLYINLLAWAHLLAGGDMAMAEAGQGGGYIGALVKQGLVGTLGVAGCAIALSAWLLVALAFTLDLSITEIFRWLPPLIEKIRAEMARTRPVASPTDAGLAASPYDPRDPREADAFSTPTGFQPISREAAMAAAAAGQGSAPRQAGQPGAPGQAASRPSEIIPAAAATPWVLPAIDAILEPGIHAAGDKDFDQQRGRLIEETLGSFGAPGHVVEIHRGPTITQFGVEPDFLETRNGRTRVRVSKIVALADDLALALAASRIRIQAPVPGRAYVGIEVPNAEISRVSLRDVMESEPFQKLRSPLRFALGEDVAGKPVSADLTTMPHLLIAGTTGSGKSVCVNSVLTCLLMNNTPDDVRLILVDPKRVELTGYNGIPHLLAPVVVDAERVVGALQWMMREMDNRYQKFSQVGARNIVDFNARLAAKGEKRIPYLVVVIDELADLMMLAPDETERTITRLAQLARATGLHLILATQRPSVDVLTGLIKANFPARIAFAVASGIDSRVILDQPGAERLLGRGDMLFQAPDAPAPVRLQGVYVSESEIQRLVEYWRSFAGQVSADAPRGGPVDDLPSGVPLKQNPLWDDMAPVEQGDPLLKEAMELVRREGRASISLLQRKMRIGYTRAARMIDTLEEKGIIGPTLPNTQVREILDYGRTAPPPEEQKLD